MAFSLAMSLVIEASLLSGRSVVLEAKTEELVETFATRQAVGTLYMCSLLGLERIM